jgi:phosphoribosylamine--glycine ligase
MEGAGVLYFGLIITKDGPRVLEYNCRFGDPETQAVLPLLDGDLVELMLASVSGTLEEVPFALSRLSAACVVVTSGGYPDAYAKGYPIAGLEEARAEGCIVFQAGTALKEGRVVTAGGRVLGITATASDLGAAIEKAYRGVGKIRFTDAFHRGDIGRRAVGRGAAARRERRSA